MGRPLAMLFFEPQKTMAISSSREKPSRRLTRVVTARATARIRTSRTTTSPRSR